MYLTAGIAIIVAMALMLIRAIVGPTVYDRVLAVNSFGTKTVLLLGVLGFLTGRPAFLDIALLYALINFIATIAILKFFRYGRLTGVMTDENPAREELR
jgi:multicomponent Na+:H+ antiporter subunit F